MTKSSLTFLSCAMALTLGSAVTTTARADITSQLKAPNGSTYYKEFGGKTGITALIDTFVGNVLADKRINTYFVHTNIPALKAALVLQVCNLEGGPCQFSMTMKGIHANMGVTQNAFNALAEDMIRAMDAERVPTAAQNNLLAKLAAMEPNIVTKA